MRADVKSELQMLRELVWFAYGARFNQAEENSLNPMLFCCFCGKPLLLCPPNISFGHRRHPKVDVDITLHHMDEDRENNKLSNLRPCHSHCHKSYHAHKRALVRKEVQSLGS